MVTSLLSLQKENVNIPERGKNEHDKAIFTIENKQNKKLNELNTMT